MWKRFNKQSAPNYDNTDLPTEDSSMGDPSYATSDTSAVMTGQQGSELRTSNSPHRTRGNTDDRGTLGNMFSSIRSSGRSISEQISESFTLADVETERKVSQAAGRLGKDIQQIISAAKAGGQMIRTSDERKSKEGADFDNDAWKTRLLQILGGTDVDVELEQNPYANSDVDVLLQNSYCEKFILRCMENELPPNLIHCLRLLRVLELQAAHSYARLQRNMKSAQTTTNSVSTSATQKVMRLLILLCKDVSVGEQLRPHLFGLLALPGASYPPNGMHIARAASEIVVAFSQSCLSQSLAMFLHDRKAILNMTDDIKELCGLIEATNVTSGSLCLYGQSAERVGLWVVGLRAIVYLVHSSCAQRCVELHRDFYEAAGYDLLSFAIWNSTTSNVKKLLELVATLTYCKLETGVTRDNSSSNFFNDFVKSPSSEKSSSTEYGLASNPGAFQLIDDLMVRSVPFLKKYGEFYNGAKVSLEIGSIRELARASLEISTELLILSKMDVSNENDASRRNNLASELLISTLQLYSDHPRNYSIIEEKYHVLSLYLISFPSFSDVSTKVLILKTLEYVCTGLSDVNPVIPLQITCEMLVAINKYRLHLSVDEASIKSHEELLSALSNDSSMLLEVLEKLALIDSSVRDALNDIGIFDHQFDELSSIVMSSVSQGQKSIDGISLPPLWTAFDEPFVIMCRLLDISLQRSSKIEIESQTLLEASLTLVGQSRDLNLLINTGVSEMGEIAAEAALATLGTKMSHYTSFSQLEIDMHFLIQLSIYFSDMILKAPAVDSFGDIYVRIILSRQTLILNTLSSVLTKNRDSIHSFRIGSGFDIILRALSSLSRISDRLSYAVLGQKAFEAVDTALQIIAQSLNLLTIAMSLKEYIADGNSPDDYMGTSFDQNLYFEKVADSIVATGLFADRASGQFIVEHILQVIEPSLPLVTKNEAMPSPQPLYQFLTNPDAIPLVLGVAVRMTIDTVLACDVIQTIYNLCLDETNPVYSQISSNKICRKLMSSTTFLKVLEDPDHPLFSPVRELFKRISMMKMTYEEFVWLVRRMIDPFFNIEGARLLQSQSKSRLAMTTDMDWDDEKSPERKLIYNLEYLTQIAEEGNRSAAIRLGGSSLNTIAFEIQRGKLEERLQSFAKEGGTRFIQLDTAEYGISSSQNTQMLSGNLAVVDNQWSATASSGFSYSLWIRIPPYALSEGHIFLLDIASAPDDDNSRLLLRPQHDYLSLFYDVKKESFHIITSSSPRPTSFSRMPLAAGKWHHVCLTYQPPKRTVLARRALLGLAVDGIIVDMDMKIDPVILPTKSRIYIGIPNPVLILSGIVNGLLVDWDLGSFILFSTVISFRDATAIYLLGPNFEGSFWGDRPQRLSLTSCATVNIADFASTDESVGVLKALEDCGVSDFESSSHNSMENRFLGAYYEDSLSTMGLLFQVSPEAVMASFRLSAYHNMNSRELCFSNLARINMSDSVTTDATAFGISSVNIPQTFADNVRWAGGPSIFFPLVHFSASVETLVLSLRLIRSCIYRHTPNTDSMQSGGGFRVLAHLLREKNIKDRRIIDECFSLATNISLFNVNADLIERHSNRLVLVDLDAMKTIVLNQHLWDLQDGPGVPLHLSARLCLLIVPNGTNAAFNARRLHQLGIVSFMLNMMLEAAKMYNLGFLGAEELKKSEAKNQNVSALAAFKNGWHVTPPSSVAVSAGGDPGNPLLFSCKNLLRRILTYMLTPMDLEAIATSVIYTLSIDNSSIIHDSSEDEVGSDSKLLPGSVARIYLIRILEELIVERIDVKGGNENVEVNRAEQTRSFLSAFSGILRPSWFMSLLDKSRDEASTSAIFRLLVLMLQTCSSFLQVFIQEDGFKTLLITIPKLSTSPAIILNILGLLLHAPIWHLPCFATLYASQLREVFESEWDNVDLIKIESNLKNVSFVISRGGFSLLLECVVRNIRLSELDDKLGQIAININDAILSVVEVCLKRCEGFKDFSRTPGILEPLTHALCESVRARQRREVISRRKCTDSESMSSIEHPISSKLPFQGLLESESRLVYIMRSLITDLIKLKPSAAIMVHAWFRSYPPHASAEEVEGFHSILIECCAMSIQECLANANQVTFSNVLGLCSVLLERLLSGLFDREDIVRCAHISTSVLQAILQTSMRAAGTVTNDANIFVGDALHINRLICLAALQRYRYNVDVRKEFQLQIDLLNIINSNLARLLTTAPVLFHGTASKKQSPDSLNYQLLQSSSVVRIRTSNIRVAYPDLHAVEDPERAFILVLLVELNYLLQDKTYIIRENALLVIIVLLRERRSVMAELMKREIRKGENRTETIDLINRGGFGALLALIDSPMVPTENAAPQLMNAAFFDWMDRNQNQVTPIFDSIREEAYMRLPIFEANLYQTTALAIDNEQKFLSDIQSQSDDNDFIMKGIERSKYLQQIHDQCSENLAVWKRLGFSDVICGGFLWQKSSLQIKGDFSFGSMNWIPQLESKGVDSAYTEPEIERLTLDLSEGYERQRRKLLPNYKFETLYNILDNDSPESIPTDSKETPKDALSNGEDESDHHADYSVDTLLQATAAMLKVSKVQNVDDIESDNDLEVDEDQAMAQRSALRQDSTMQSNVDVTEALPSDNISTDNREVLLQESETNQDDGNHLDGKEIIASSLDLVMGFLVDGDRPEKVYNVKRCIGLEVRRAILLWCSRAIYIIDGFEKVDGDGESLLGRINRVEQYVTTFSISLRSQFAEKGEPGLTENVHVNLEPVHDNAVSKKKTQKSEEAIFRHRSQRISFDDIYCIYRRRYQLRQNALEFYDINKTGILVAFDNQAKREEVLMNTFNARLPNSIFSSGAFGSTMVMSYNKFMNNYRAKVTNDWVMGRISNFEFIMNLNTFAGRSYNDLTQYPVFPWIIADYESDNIDLNDPSIYRDLAKPMGAIGESRAKQFKDRYDALEMHYLDQEEHEQPPPFHYGTHYSCAAYVVNYLIRLEPFSRLALTLQGGKFDLADRLFQSVAASWRSASRDNLQDVRELIPEFFYLPDFLLNKNSFDYGVTQHGKVVNHVTLPPWSKGDPRRFVRIQRKALESDYVSRNLHKWVDLVFGYKQRGREAIEALNTFVHVTYEGAVDLDTIEDPVVRESTLAQINNFGQAPSRLEKVPFPSRIVSSILKDKNVDLNALAHISHLTPSFCIPGAPHKVIMKSHALETCRLGLSRQEDLGVGDVFVSKGSVLGVASNCVFLSASTYVRYDGQNNGISFHVASVSSRYREVDKVLSIVDDMHSSPIKIARISLDSHFLITTCSDATVRVWRVKTNTRGYEKNYTLRLLGTLSGHEGVRVTCMDICTMFGSIVTGDAKGVILVWNLRTLGFLRKLPTDEIRSSTKQHQPAVSVSLNRKNGNVVTLVGSSLKIFDINGNPVATLPMDFKFPMNNMPTCAISTNCQEWMDGIVAITGHMNGDVRMWSVDYERGLLVFRHVIPEKVHDNPITCLRCLDNQKSLLIGDSIGRVSMASTLQLDSLSVSELAVVAEELRMLSEVGIR